MTNPLTPLANDALVTVIGGSEQAVLVLVRPNDSANGAPIEQASGNSRHSALLVVLRENKR